MHWAADLSHHRAYRQAARRFNRIKMLAPAGNHRIRPVRAFRLQWNGMKLHDLRTKIVLLRCMVEIQARIDKLLKTGI